MTLPIARAIATAATLATLLAACGNGDDGGFAPIDATAPGDATAGGDTAPSLDAAPPSLGEPEWRLVSTAALDPGDEEWRGVHGTTLDDGGYLTAVVGTNGTVALYDSAEDAWSFRNVGVALEVLSVWVEDRDTMIVVGEEGLARRWDPTLVDDDGNATGDWLLSTVVGGQDADIHDIWGDRDDSQWICGDRGLVARWDDLGERWDVQLYPGNDLTEGAKLESIWGTSPGEIFAVGNRIILRKLSGQDWERIDPGEIHLWGVWGTRDGPVYAVGDGGTILALDRATDTWNNEQVGFLPYRSVYGFDAETVYVGAFNTNLARLTPSGWEITVVTARPGAPEQIPGNLRFIDIWGTDEDNLFFVTSGPELVRRGRFPIP